MKKGFFSRFENKVLFRTSRVFWNIFAWVACFAAVGGVLAWLWSQTPTGERTVVKEAYPGPVSISISDLDLTLPPPPRTDPIQESTGTQSTPVQQPATTNSTATTPAVTGPDPAEVMFNAVLDSIKAAYPHLDWEPKGERVVTDQTSYNYYMQKGQSAQANKFTRFVVSGSGLSGHLKSKLKRCCGDRYFARYTSVLRYMFNELDRLYLNDEDESLVVSKLVQSLKCKSVEIEYGIASVFGIAQAFEPQDRVNALVTAVEFVNKRPQLHYAFHERSARLLRQLEPDQRSEALSILKKNLSGFSPSAVDQLYSEVAFYDTLFAEVPVDRQALALEQVFKVHRQKKQARSGRIAQIEQRYNSALSSARAEKRETETLKWAVSGYSWKAVAGGVVAVAVLALILAVLSVQRAISRLDGAVDKLARSIKTEGATKDKA